MAGLLLPEPCVITEPDIVECPGAAEFFVDGAVCRFRAGLVHILAYRIFGNRAEHVATWHCRGDGFEPSFIAAYWRWRQAGAMSDLGARIMLS